MSDAAQRFGNNLRFSFTSDAVDINTFSVVAMEGYEALSRPFKFTVTLMADIGKKIVLDQVLSGTATLNILVPPPNTRRVPYHGVLEEFEELQKTATTAFYRAVLVPRFARTKLDRRSDLYQGTESIDKTLADILQKTITPRGSSDVRFSLTEKYPERESVCQYEEPTFDFVSRWLEKEGMFYYFNHGDTPDADHMLGAKQFETMVIADNNIGLPAAITEVFYRARGHNEIDRADRAVHEFTSRRVRLPKQVTLQDFNYREATKPLRITQDIPAFDGTRDTESGVVMIYGEDVRDELQGKRYAKLRAEEIGCGGTLYFGAGTAVGLRSGHFMKMAGLPLSLPPGAANEFLVTEIEHKGSQASMLLEGMDNPFKELEGEIFYSNSFTAIHRSTQFRPARTTPRPFIPGTMSAVVAAYGDNGSGEIADLDEKGQYKVKLPFADGYQAYGNASVRIRMATPYAGGDHGMDFPLHRDAEVLLSFINGDPDQPVIMSAVPNSANPALVNQKNPLTSEIKTAGGNAITLDDTNGEQSLRLETPNLRGTLFVGGASGNIFFSGNTANSITAVSDYSYVGILGSVSAVEGNRIRVGRDKDLDVLTGLLRHTTDGHFNWASDTSMVRSISEAETRNIEKITHTAASQSITLEAGYDKDDLVTELKLKLAKAKGITAKGYMNLVQMLKFIPGTVPSVRALAAGSAVPTSVKSLDINNRFDVDAYSKLDIGASVPSALAATLSYGFFESVFNAYEKIACVSRINIADEGIHQTFKRGSKPEAGLSLTENGVLQRSVLADLTGNKSIALQNLDSKLGAMLTAEKSGLSGSETLTRLELGVDGKAVLFGSKDVKLTGNKVGLITDGSSINVDDCRVDILASGMKMGYIPPPLFSMRITRGKKKASLLTQKVMIMQGIAERITRMKEMQQPGFIAKILDPKIKLEAMAEYEAAGAHNLALEMKNMAAKVELTALDVAIEAIKTLEAAGEVEMPSPGLHGISIGQTEVALALGLFGVKATQTQLAMGMGGSGVTVGMVGLSITDDKLIKIG